MTYNYHGRIKPYHSDAVSRYMRRYRVDVKSALGTIKEIYRQKGMEAIPDELTVNGRHFSVYYATPHDNKRNIVKVGRTKLVIV